MTITIPREVLMEELGLPYENVIEETIIDTTRWSIIYEIIFEYNGKYYRTTYSTGATEQQYESPWDYEENIECTEVEQKEVMVRRWVEVGDNNEN